FCAQHRLGNHAKKKNAASNDQAILSCIRTLIQDEHRAATRPWVHAGIDKEDRLSIKIIPGRCGCNASANQWRGIVLVPQPARIANEHDLLESGEVIYCFYGWD